MIGKSEWKLLMLLYEQGPLYKHALQFEMRMSWRRLEEVLERLAAKGLVEVRPPAKRPFRKYVALTEKGERVCELLAEVGRLISGG